MPDAQAQALGARVRKAREAAELSQVGLAERIPGLHQASLARIEVGERALKALEAVAIARETGIDLDRLIRGDDRAPEDLVRATKSTTPQNIQRRLNDFAEEAQDRRNEILRLADEVPDVAEIRKANISRALYAWNIAAGATGNAAREIGDEIIGVDEPLVIRDELD